MVRLHSNFDSIFLSKQAPVASCVVRYRIMLVNIAIHLIRIKWKLLNKAEIHCLVIFGKTSKYDDL